MTVTRDKILIIEDERNQIELIKYNLEVNGYEVVVSEDGEDGFLKCLEVKPDLVLIDWMLPKFSGIEVCRKIRKNNEIKEIPIIMVTARSEEIDKVRGLDVGADDFVTKPYSISELIARVRAAMRRPNAQIVSDKISVGPIVLDIKKHTVKINNISIELGPTEYRLLLCLMKQPNRVFSREQLLDIVWGISVNIDTRTVDVHIGRLRKEIDKASGRKLIKTVRGFGYALNS